MNSKDIVKKLAAQKKITIAELERKLNIANGTIGKWDKQNPSIDPLNKLADYFDVPTDYLLGRTNLLNNNTNEDMAKKLMMRMNTDGLSENDINDIEKEMERFFAWRIEEIKKERREK